MSVPSLSYSRHKVLSVLQTTIFDLLSTIDELINTKTLKSDESVHKCLLHIYGSGRPKRAKFFKNSSCQETFPAICSINSIYALGLAR